MAHVTSSKNLQPTTGQKRAIVSLNSNKTLFINPGLRSIRTRKNNYEIFVVDGDQEQKRNKNDRRRRTRGCVRRVIGEGRCPLTGAGQGVS